MENQVSNEKETTQPASEERYRALFNALDAGFCIIEPLHDETGEPFDYRFIEVNPAFEKQTGLAHALGKRIRDLRPTLENYWYEIYDRVATTGEPVRFVNHAAALGRWFDVYAFRVGQPENRHVGVLFTDITQRKKADDLLREREEQLRAIFESATEIAIVVSDCDRNITTWNAGAQRLLGYTADEIQGRSADILFTPEDRAANAPERESRIAVEQGQALNERWHVRKDGTRFWGSGFMFPLREGHDQRGFLKIMRDRTAERQAQEALQRSEERLRIAVESAQLGTWDYDPETTIVTANERFREIFGIGLNTELTYAACINAVHPDDRERVNDRAQRVLRGEADGKYNDEYRTVSSIDGSERWVRAAGRAYFNSDGRLSRFVGTVLDITGVVKAREVLERRGEELELLVRQRTAQLRDTVQQLETFSYSVVHDMRAPLRSMRSFANVLSEEYGPNLDAKARNYLARVIASADRMDALITDVLSYSRLSSAEATPMRVDLDKLLHEIVEQYPQFQEASESVSIASPLPIVWGNRALLTQCVSNLLGNALKFVHPGTRPRVLIRAERHKDKVRLWIEDNGIGIPAEYRERIFGLFQRLHRSDEFPGTGVGLAIVKKAVERMHGTLGVESEPGHGSRFWMELPAPAS